MFITRDQAAHHQVPRARRWAGFTLIELLVVLVILGLLAGLVGPQVLKYVGRSKSDTARLQIAQLGAALDLYLVDIGRYPTTDEGLGALVSAPSGVRNWNGPYLKKGFVPKDPWGHDYTYRAPGQHGPYDLFSLGADNRQGGTGEDADVNSWE
ncbi:type II secretion system major pseudopilin GspG [Thiofaba sp. EF100]|uniref:type II secretion system major pseudopilin GspG n=1 Tax=Thiofaba sp. EF100 TaxID=3121274 RepID=UPI003221988D